MVNSRPAQATEGDPVSMINYYRAEEMAQLIQRLPCKFESLSLIPGTYT